MTYCPETNGLSTINGPEALEVAYYDEVDNLRYEIGEVARDKSL